MINQLNEVGLTEPTEIEQIDQFLKKHKPQRYLVMAISKNGRTHANIHPDPKPHPANDHGRID